MIFAEQRSSTTQFELGEMFRKSDDQTRDYTRAAEWFLRSAKQGYRKAQYQIGLMYARGLGVKQDYIEAYAWLKVAASQGSAKAIQCLKRYAHYLPASKQDEARALSRAYYEQYVAPFAPTSG